jgi:hypothetical protein
MRTLSPVVQHGGASLDQLGAQFLHTITDGADPPGPLVSPAELLPRQSTTSCGAREAMTNQASLAMPGPHP